jgi:two-component sensor histidine kinase
MRKTKKKKERGKSKFFEKYQERINSIQESDEKLKVRKEQEEKEKQEFLKEVKKEKTKKK